MKSNIPLFFMSLLFAIMSVAGADAMASPKLILQLEDNETLDVPLDPAQPLSILPSGDLAARATSEFSCNLEGEECPVCPPCDGVQVSMASGNGSFSVSPSSVVQGGSVNFSWTSRGAWSCSGSDLPGSTWNSFVGAPNGSSGSVSTAALEVGSYSPRVTCCNGPTCATRVVSLQVNEPSAGIEGCEDRPPPTQLTRASSCAWGSTNPDSSVDCTSWESFFRRPFPEGSSSRQFYQRPNEYLALEFNTGSYSGSTVGRIDSEAAQFGFPSTFQGGDKLMTISRCPGDFNRAAIIADSEAACYMRGQALDSVQWSPLGLTSPWYCALQPNTTYYLNIMFTNSPAGTNPNQLNWTCTGGSTNCGRLYQIQ